MDSWRSVWTLLLLVCCKLAASSGVIKQTFVATECFGNVLSLSCKAGHRIKVLDDFFGVSERTGGGVDSCMYKPGDCTVTNNRYTSVIHRYCEGKQSCTNFQVDRRYCGINQTNYEQVEYGCVPDKEVSDFCIPSNQSAVNGYIATPNFPDEYPPNLHCTCSLRVDQRNARIQLESTHFIVKFDEPCKDWVDIETSSGTRRRCGAYRSTLVSNFFRLTFHSDEREGHQGLWLFYSVIPEDSDAKVTVQCVPEMYLTTPAPTEPPTTYPMTTEPEVVPETTTPEPALTTTSTTSTTISSRRRVTESREQVTSAFPPMTSEEEESAPEVVVPTATTTFPTTPPSISDDVPTDQRDLYEDYYDSLEDIYQLEKEDSNEITPEDKSNNRPIKDQGNKIKDSNINKVTPDNNYYYEQFPSAKFRPTPVPPVNPWYRPKPKFDDSKWRDWEKRNRNNAEQNEVFKGKSEENILQPTVADTPAMYGEGPEEAVVVDDLSAFRDTDDYYDSREDEESIHILGGELGGRSGDESKKGNRRTGIIVIAVCVGGIMLLVCVLGILLCMNKRKRPHSKEKNEKDKMQERLNSLSFYDSIPMYESIGRRGGVARVPRLEPDIPKSKVKNGNKAGDKAEGESPYWTNIQAPVTEHDSDHDSAIYAELDKQSAEGSSQIGTPATLPRKQQQEGKQERKQDTQTQRKRPAPPPPNAKQSNGGAAKKNDQREKEMNTPGVTLDLSEEEEEAVYTHV